MLFTKVRSQRLHLERPGCRAKPCAELSRAILRCSMMPLETSVTPKFISPVVPLPIRRTISSTPTMRSLSICKRPRPSGSPSHHGEAHDRADEGVLRPARANAVFHPYVRRVLQHNPTVSGPSLTASHDGIAHNSLAEFAFACSESNTVAVPGRQVMLNLAERAET